MEPAGGDPGTMKRRLAAMNLGLARPKIRFVCLGLDWGDPFRTAGNEGVPLQ